MSFCQMAPPAALDQLLPLTEYPEHSAFSRGLFLWGLHLKDRIKIGKLEQPGEAPWGVDEDKPSPSGCAPSMGGQERTKPAQIDECQTGTVDQDVAVDVRQSHIKLWGSGQVELSGQYNLVIWHGDRW
jgi:hypothetical protein